MKQKLSIYIKNKDAPIILYDENIDMNKLSSDISKSISLSVFLKIESHDKILVINPRLVEYFEVDSQKETKNDVKENKSKRRGRPPKKKIEVVTEPENEEVLDVSNPIHEFSFDDDEDQEDINIPELNDSDDLESTDNKDDQSNFVEEYSETDELSEDDNVILKEVESWHNEVDKEEEN